MDRMDAFRKGLMRWAKWVNSAVDTSKTKVIYQGITPTHYEYVNNSLFLVCYLSYSYILCVLDLI